MIIMIRYDHYDYYDDYHYYDYHDCYDHYYYYDYYSYYDYYDYHDHYYAALNCTMQIIIFSTAHFITCVVMSIVVRLLCMPLHMPSHTMSNMSACMSLRHVLFAISHVIPPCLLHVLCMSFRQCHYSNVFFTMPLFQCLFTMPLFQCLFTMPLFQHVFLRCHDGAYRYPLCTSQGCVHAAWPGLHG